MKKYILGILFVITCITAYAEDLGDGYQTIIPCFKFNVITPNGEIGKFEYVVLSKSSLIKKGTIYTADKNSTAIQWCDNGLSHVQKNMSLHDVSNKYTVAINGISFRNLKIATAIDISDHISISEFNGGNTDTLSRAISVKYNDILQSSNNKFTQSQFGTGIEIKKRIGSFLDCDSWNSPSDGDCLTYQHSDHRTQVLGKAIFRKSWLISNLTVPLSISNYHPLNTRNFKIESTTGALDYEKSVYDENDIDTQAMINFNLKTDQDKYFSGYYSGIGVINGVMYGTYVIRSIFGIPEIHTLPSSLSYKTACVTSDYDYEDHKTKVALLENDSNGALRCVLYKPDFPQGEYLNSCPGINYDPINRTLTTDCYDNNQKLTHHITKLGVIGSQTPRYKNVNGSLVAY